MELLELLKQKAEYFSTYVDDRGIASVVSHIEIAERHYENGKLGDDYLFNDVIYRSNQAFEGALKEAYRIITEQDPCRVTPYAIEKHFEEHSVLKERVLQLFTNYRTEWRNKSTHDYKLYFSEQEAFLAIVNISAFINILLDQMVEKRAYDKETAALKEMPISDAPKPESKDILHRITELLISFSDEVPNYISGTTIPRITSSALAGALSAFLNNFTKDIDVFSDYSIVEEPDKPRYIVDYFLKKGEERLIIEVKNSLRVDKQFVNSGTEQLLVYLTTSGITEGILYIPPLVQDEELEVEKISREISGKTYNIVQIFQYRKSRRPNLNFIEMGIPIGAELKFDSKEVNETVRVVSGRKVDFRGEEAFLTSVTRELLDLPYSVNPTPHWLYQGKNLLEFYGETYGYVS